MVVGTTPRHQQPASGKTPLRREIPAPAAEAATRGGLLLQSRPSERMGSAAAPVASLSRNGSSRQGRIGR